MSCRENRDGRSPSLPQRPRLRDSGRRTATSPVHFVAIGAETSGDPRRCFRKTCCIPQKPTPQAQPKPRPQSLPWPRPWQRLRGHWETGLFGGGGWHKASVFGPFGGGVCCGDVEAGALGGGGAKGGVSWGPRVWGPKTVLSPLGNCRREGRGGGTGGGAPPLTVRRSKASLRGAPGVGRSAPAKRKRHPRAWGRGAVRRFPRRGSMGGVTSSGAAGAPQQSELRLIRRSSSLWRGWSRWGPVAGSTRSISPWRLFLSLAPLSP